MRRRLHGLVRDIATELRPRETEPDRDIDPIGENGERADEPQRPAPRQDIGFRDQTAPSARSFSISAGA